MRTSDFRPKRRTNECIIQELPEETLVFDQSRKEGFCLNRISAMVWRLCDGRKTVADLAHILKREGIAENLLMLSLRELSRASLLTEPLPEVTKSTRREMLGKIGAAAAAVTTLVFVGRYSNASPGSSLGMTRRVPGSTVGMRRPSARRKAR